MYSISWFCAKGSVRCHKTVPVEKCDTSVKGNVSEGIVRSCDVNVKCVVIKHAKQTAM
jgi:hypothetical protein